MVCDRSFPGYLLSLVAEVSIRFTIRKDLENDDLISLSRFITRLPSEFTDRKVSLIIDTDPTILDNILDLDTALSAIWLEE